MAVVIRWLTRSRPAAPPQRYPSLHLVEEAIEKQLNAQIDHIDALDTKAGILLGFLALTLASVIANKDVAEIIGKSGVLKGAVAAILAAFLLALAAFAIRQYRRDPNPRQLRQLYPSAPQERTHFDLADAYIASFEHNLGQMKWKIRSLRLAMALAGLGGVGFAGHVIFGW